MAAGARCRAAAACSPALVLRRVLAACGFCIVGLLPVAAPAEEQRGAVPSEARTAAETALWRAAAEALARNDFASAKPSLERLVARYPDRAAYRVALGRVLVAQGRFARARFQLRRAQGTGGSAAVERAARQMLDAIERHDLAGGHFSFAIVPDSNPGRRSATGSFRLGNLDFELEGGGAPSGVTIGLRTELGGYRRFPLSDRTRLTLAVGTSSLMYEDSDWNDISANVLGRIERKLNARSRVSLGAAATHRWRGGEPYATSYALFFGYDRQTGRATTMGAQLSLGQVDYTSITGADGRLWGARFYARRTIAPSAHVTGSVKFLRTYAAAATQAGHMAGASLSLNKTFPGGLGIGLSVGASLDRKDAAHPVFGRRQSDRIMTVSSRMRHSAINIGGFTPELEVSFEQRDSTIEIRDYDRTSISAGLTRKF